jgi:predicted molibdopterin-dependent oxidoreductase YjgC
MGENPAMTDPDLAHVRRCLAAAEFVVSQELFLSETARYAHVVLPAAGTAEKDGSVTNTDRRVQRLGVAADAPGDARPDWWILAELGRRIATMTPTVSATARLSGWHYEGPERVMEEIAAITPIYGGIRLSRLGRNGLQWPCPTIDHPGTPILHVGGALRGRARLTPVPELPPAEVPDAAFPLVLTTGRLLEHYHAGSMSRRVAGLAELAPEAFVEMDPGDASRYGLAHGAMARLRTRRGVVRARVHVTGRIVPGSVFMPFHFAEAAANELTNRAIDPVAKIPEFKVCAVAVEPADAAAPHP